MFVPRQHPPPKIGSGNKGQKQMGEKRSEEGKETCLALQFAHLELVALCFILLGMRMIGSKMCGG